MADRNEPCDSSPISQGTDEIGCSARWTGTTIGLTLLGAAVAIPAVCFYLSKYFAGQGRAAFRRHRPFQRGSSRFTKDHRARERIRIPIQEEALRIDSEPDVPARTAEGAPPDQTEAPTAPFVGSTERDRFHIPACRWARQIQEAHRISFETREAAL
ncbi:MAG: hypothetical protein MUQ30_04590, partial [Anaerolineae bacterium]|nr:hypothetical protein [Anaerolineae bacterium]